MPDRWTLDDLSDEDETETIVDMTGTVRAVVFTGVETAISKVRYAYIKGCIDVDEFEAEMGRLLRKLAMLERGHS